MTYGILLEFSTPDNLVAATRAAYEKGFRKLEAYSPFPIEELEEAMVFKKNRVPLFALIGGIVGGLTAYSLQYYAAVIAYPMNIGGRPYHSWPAFIPITFELTVLFSALSAVGGMLWLNGLPQPYHPLFNSPQFQLATRNRFFLCVEYSDPLVKSELSFLKELSELSFTEVPE